MPRAPLSRPARTSAAAGLRTLIDLINDAVMAMGTQPAFNAPAFNAPAPAQQAAIETPPAAPRGLRGRRPTPHANTPDAPTPHAPTPDAATTPQDAAPDDPADPSDLPPDPPEVDPDHVETWLLVRRAQAGDGEAFGTLYDRYVDAVFRFVYFRIHDRALAEDFTSETFLRALRRIGTITYQGRDIGAWFITIARNIVFDHMKSARHRLESPTAETIEGKEYVRSTESAVLDTLQSEHLMEAVDKLGAEQRECIMLRFIHGLTVSETAAAMGKNDGAIKALQHRAVRKLAGLIGDDLR